MPWRWSIRRTAPASPTARRARCTYAEADRVISAHRRAAARHRAADRHGGGDAARQHGRERDRAARRAARRHDRRAAAAAVAAAGHDRRARSRRRQGHHHRRRASAPARMPSWPCRSRRSCFPIRYVCGFGDDPARRRDAVRRYLRRRAPTDLPPRARRPGNPAAHVAVVTWTRRADGLSRSRATIVELIAAGVAVVSESGIAPDATILSTISARLVRRAVAHAAAVAVERRHAASASRFDAEAFATQCDAVRGGMVVVPGPRWRRSRRPAALDGAEIVAALWRAPERLTSAAPWLGDAALIDVASFGETGLIAARREADGVPLPIPLGYVRHPRGAADAMADVEIMRTKAGTLALRGPWCRVHGFPPGAGRADPCRRRDRTSSIPAIPAAPATTRRR